MQIAGARRIGDFTAGRDDRRSRLGEIERRFAIDLISHLGCMFGIVATDTEDAMDGKARAFALDRNQRRGRDLE
ncbi:hypothetical protein D3C87_1737150 [compost metagenome]